MALLFEHVTSCTIRKSLPWLIAVSCMIQILMNWAGTFHQSQGDPPDFAIWSYKGNLTARSTNTPLTFSPLKRNMTNNINVDRVFSSQQSSSASSLWSIETSYLYVLPEYGKIRKWGCRLGTVPFVFVHIGKTGGGNVRARLAASSLNYTKESFRHQDFSYYPLKRNEKVVKRRHWQNRYDDEGRAQFCHTGFHMFKPQPIGTKNRRSLQCNATTPLGQAIACPELFHDAYDPNRTRILDQNFQTTMIDKLASLSENETIKYHNRNALRYRRHPCFLPPSSDHAHVVFVGHHNLGSEMHWLPSGFLSDWWNTLWSTPSANPDTTTETAAATTAKKVGSVSIFNPLDLVSQKLQSLGSYYDVSNFPNHFSFERDHGSDTNWCLGQPRPIFAYDENVAFHQRCSQDMYQTVDELAKQAVRKRMSQINIAASTNRTVEMAGYWSTVYASLPVLRVTILREPFSWLCSKFFWHKVHKLFNVTCDDAETATRGSWLSIQNKKQPDGWARRMALLYLEQLCGDDCVVRSYYSTENVLDEIELQATANLRQAFAVVGILPDLDDFYDLIDRRIEYMNTSLNQHVMGLKHESSFADQDEVQRCREIYLQNRTFRRLMLQAPEIAALQRLYDVGIQVNRFQRQELEQC